MLYMCVYVCVREKERENQYVDLTHIYIYRIVPYVCSVELKSIHPFHLNMTTKSLTVLCVLLVFLQHNSWCSFLQQEILTLFVGNSQTHYTTLSNLKCLWIEKIGNCINCGSRLLLYINNEINIIKYKEKKNPCNFFHKYIINNRSSMWNKQNTFLVIKTSIKILSLRTMERIPNFDEQISLLWIRHVIMTQLFCHFMISKHNLPQCWLG